MKVVVISEFSDVTRERIMEVYPGHKQITDQYVERNDVIGMGPFTDGGNMFIFKTREAAEQFVKEDPFILEGVVKSFIIKEWMDVLLPE
jgi:uncharacterized protein YciI